jgi:alpha-beta hydrolase superfamily lysophospholipase
MDNIDCMKRQMNLIFLLLLFMLTGCMPMIHPYGSKISTAQLDDNFFLSEDGVQLPLRHWLPTTPPKAIIIALHGFNDYSHFFEMPGEYFSQRGIACFAYDQRGFGAAPLRGLWAGSETYAKDLQVLVNLIQQHYPSLPIYLLGESMGGAIVITAMGQADMPNVAGIILAAPALWARETMPWYQTSLLWTLAHSLPWLTLTGQGLHVMASDNIDMLRALGRDPLIIKATRVEAIYGLADLMDDAYNSASNLHVNTLLLYGENDQIIPKEPTFTFLQQLLQSETTEKAEKTVAIYQQGYHMLLRDLQAKTAWQDILAWIQDSPDKLPSGADQRARQLLSSQLETSE